MTGSRMKWSYPPLLAVVVLAILAFVTLWSEYRPASSESHKLIVTLGGVSPPNAQSLDGLSPVPFCNALNVQSSHAGLPHAAFLPAVLQRRAAGEAAKIASIAWTRYALAEGFGLYAPERRNWRNSGTTFG